MLRSGAAVLLIFVCGGAAEQPSTVGNATEGGGGGNSTSDTEDVATSTHAPSSAPADLPMSRFLEPATTQTTSQAPEEDPSPGFNAMTILSSTKVLEHLRYAVVRIQAVQADNDWFKPWEPFGEKEGVGTGFIVSSDKNGVLIVTNAHVVKNALSVQVQLPVLGQAEYDAHVPLICNDFDLALVHIANPKQLHEAVEAQNQTLRTLPMRSPPIEIGSEVAAFGFPLGSLSPKLSRGVISGIEQIGDQVSYQTTAPISPGNSGGPLLAYGQNKELEVAGVTFASATAAGTQNNNYVVPALRVVQVLREFQTAPKKKVGIGVLGTPLKTTKDGKVEVSSSFVDVKKPDHRQLQLAPFGAITVEADEALYNTSDGCDKGVFISSILPLSLLRFAEPPVKEHSFLVAVGDSKIDSFGMGSTPLFLGGPIPFEGLLALGKSPGDPVKLRTCKDGKEKTHNASLSWREEYTPGIDEVNEPLYSTKSTEFEVFSGITIMQMTVNHIASLMSHGAPVTLGRWLLPDYQLKPHLIVTHIAPNTYASHILASGMVITSLNGHNISTLNDFREHFIPEGAAWELETDRGLLYTVNFREVIEKQLDDSQRVESNRYLMTKTISRAAEKLGISTPGAASTNLLKFSMSSSKGNLTDSISGAGDRPIGSPKAPESPLGVDIERHVSPGSASLAEEAATAAAAQATAAAKVAELAAAQATAAGKLARKAEADEKTADRKTADLIMVNTKVNSHGLTLGHSSIVF